MPAPHRTMPPTDLEELKRLERVHAAEDRGLFIGVEALRRASAEGRIDDWFAPNPNVAFGVPARTVTLRNHAFKEGACALCGDTSGDMLAVCLVATDATER